MNASRNRFPLRNAHVTIVGLGLMGGSLALGLKPHVRRLTGVEADDASRQMALERNVVDDVTSALEAGTAQADLVVLATPVGSILSVIETIPRWRKDGCALLDLGSTKSAICAAMDQLPPEFGALGGHPMCGKESSGLRFAEATLYRDQTFVLCRTRRTDSRSEALALSVLDTIRARPLFLEPDEHDRLVATVSHLPYFLAALLIQQTTAVAEDHKDLWTVSASGFRDTARLSGSGARMLTDIVVTNRPLILAALRRHSAGLSSLIALLESADNKALYAWLQARQDEHDAYLRARS